jgi:hypothetical protein
MDLLSFILWFWISLAVTAFVAVWWFIIVRRRETWLRWTEAEAAFWLRLRVPAATVESIKRKEQSKGYAYSIGALCIFWFLLMALNAGAYLHFRSKQRETRPPDHRAALDAAITRLLHSEHHWHRASERGP